MRQEKADLNVFLLNRLHIRLKMTPNLREGRSPELGGQKGPGGVPRKARKWSVTVKLRYNGSTKILFGRNKTGGSSSDVRGSWRNTVEQGRNAVFSVK